MANEIQSAFNAVYSDGPSSKPTEPLKSRIRDEVGGTIQAKVDALQAGIDEAKAIAVVGRHALTPVRVATTTNGTLASAFENGDTIDGVVLATGDRILLKDQTTGSQNGVYTVNASGAPTRATDADTGAELLGATVYVTAGTANKGRTYTCSNTTAPSVGTDAIAFVLVSEQNTAIPSALDGLRGKGANIASAATVDLSIATGDVITVTGTTAITSFGTMAAGVERTIIASSELPITASANIITPFGQSFVLSAKDALVLKSLGGGVWQVTNGITGPTITQKADLSEPGLRTDPTGFIIRPLMYASLDGTAHLPQVDIVPADMDYPDTYVDPTGFRIPTRAEAMIAAGAGGGSGGGGWGEAYWVAQDAAGAAYGGAVANRPIPEVADFYWDYNLVFAYGQSRSVGGVSHPAKTITAPSWGITAKSVGTSVGSSDESNTFVPFGAIADPSIGSFTLQPLIGTVDIDDPGGGRREDPITFTGSVTSGLGGERPIVGFTYSFHRLWNESRGELTGNYGNRVPIAASQGFGGQLLEDLLSDSNIPGHPFSTKKRAESYCGQLQSYVTGTLGKTIGMALCTFWQGEANASSTDYATMLGLLGDLKTFLHDDLADGIFGQAKMPIIIMTQVTEHWTVDKPAIPQAQNDFALANQDVFISAPSYATPGKMEIPGDGVSMPTVLNEHKDGNGSRWHGEYDAKVAHQVLRLRRYWEHMHLIGGTFKAGGNQVLLTWHTPVGPIQARPCYVGYRTSTLSNWGIAIKQNGSELSIVDKVIYGTNSVLVTVDGILATGLPTTAEYAIADGRGNIWDSDPAVGRFTYDSHIRDYASSTPISGSMTAQEIAIQAEVDASLGSLYGKPYPLFNAAVAEVFTLTEIME